MELIEESRSRLRLRYLPQDRFDQGSEPGLSRQISAVAGDVDACQHDLGMAGFNRGAQPARRRLPSAPTGNCLVRTQ